MIHEFIVATGNKGKLREICELLADLPLNVTSLADHWNPVPDIPETGDTFYANALQKADWVFSRLGGWVLADDSGLEVDALDGRPGVRSARFAGEGAGTAANNRLLLDQLADVKDPHRTARFRCCAVLVTSATERFRADGTCEGRIGFEPLGSEGFGYDPLFFPAGYDRTFGEMGSDEKHTLSHRAKAMEKIRERLREMCR